MREVPDPILDFGETYVLHCAVRVEAVRTGVKYKGPGRLSPTRPFNIGIGGSMPIGVLDADTIFR